MVSTKPGATKTIRAPITITITGAMRSSDSPILDVPNSILNTVGDSSFCSVGSMFYIYPPHSRPAGDLVCAEKIRSTFSALLRGYLVTFHFDGFSSDLFVFCYIICNMNN